MAAIITSKFRFMLAETFTNKIGENLTDNIYLGVSKCTPWSDELNPPFPGDSYQIDAEDFSELLTIKKVRPENLCYVVPRHDWDRNVTFMPLKEGDPEKFENNKNPFYCITNNSEVFKLVYKDNPSALPKVEPVAGNSKSGFINTGDGHIWKYLYRVPQDDIEMFMNTSWIPVRKVISSNDKMGIDQWEVQQSATKGTIDSISIIFSGAYYSSTLTAKDFSIVGDGTGAEVSAVSIDKNTGEILSVTLKKGADGYPLGEGYTKAKLVINDAERNKKIQNGEINPTVSDAIFEFNFSRPNGHGSAAYEELGAFYVMIGVELKYHETTKNNDYRKIILVESPTVNVNGQNVPATNDIYHAMTKVTFVNGTFMQDNCKRDAVLTNTDGSVTCTLVDWEQDDDGMYSAWVIDISGTLAQSDNLYLEETNTLIGTIFEVNKDITEIIVPHTGDILYRDYRRHVSRDPEQNERINIVLAF